MSSLYNKANPEEINPQRCVLNREKFESRMVNENGSYILVLFWNLNKGCSCKCANKMIELFEFDYIEQAYI